MIKNFFSKLLGLLIKEKMLIYIKNPEIEAVMMEMLKFE